MSEIPQKTAVQRLKLAGAGVQVKHINFYFVIEADIRLTI